jgi:hypothetical protein
LRDWRRSFRRRCRSFQGLFRVESILNMPFRLPLGPPPRAPWKRQTAQPRTAGALHRSPVRFAVAEHVGARSPPRELAERCGAFSRPKPLWRSAARSSAKPELQQNARFELYSGRLARSTIKSKGEHNENSSFSPLSRRFENTNARSWRFCSGFERSNNSAAREEKEIRLSSVVWKSPSPF